MAKSIRYIKHSMIDKDKWDNCVTNAIYPIIYPCSWYLDVTAKDWDALVMGDYEAVMPLPWRKKLGVKYIFQPFFTQQLGIFSRIERIDISRFLKNIPDSFKYITLSFNENNLITDNILRENVNYLLDISGSYQEVSNHYKRNCKRNLKKSEEAEFNIVTDLSPVQFSNFIQGNLEGKIAGVGGTEFQVLTDLVRASLSRHTGEVVALADRGNKIHAAGFYLFSNDRLIFSVCASTKYGMDNQAMYKLVDSQIKKYAGKYKWYDFSGSNIKGVAYFNSTFGASPTIYKTLQINRLPSWLKPFKN